MGGRWDSIPDKSTIEETVAALERKGIMVMLVESGGEALARLKELIPRGAEVMRGSSKTLDQIGFTDYLRAGSHGWVNLHDQVLGERDEAKRQELRRRAVSAEYFLGSINAISMGGALVACDKTGSRVGAYLYAAKNLILVAGVQKITRDLDEACQRVREYVFPLEDQRVRNQGLRSAPNKWIIIEEERVRDRITLILVRERLGY